MYQALYRKWRPKAFADVVGQSHITDTLRRQAAQNRLSHAYLFTGTRGTGKTTCAKILAKAVNCQNPADGDPCNACPACLGIDNGSLLDVLELDAASNNGVDHVRALRDDAVYAPASVKYRVYIIDEVHMLSVAAFNALLKILEEPPAHLIFILATTELHKVPATILSRCQRFAFKRIRPQDIADRLQYVAQQEGMTLAPDAAGLLARLSDGALRDGLSLLDQCGAAGGVIDTPRVLDVLGLAGNVQTAELMRCILRRDVESALLALDRLYCGGKDVGALLNELSALTRDLLIRMTAPKGGMELLSGGYDDARLSELSQGVPPRRLLFMASQLQAAAAALPLSPNRRTDAELCLLRLCDESLCGDTAALSARIARLEEAVRTGTPAAPPQPVRRAKPVQAVKKAAPPPPPPAEDRPPWDEEPPPLPDNGSPPWDMDPPPLPDDGPPPYGEPVRPAPRPRVAPSPEPAPIPAEPKPAAVKEETDGLWGNLLERIKERLTPMYWYMLEDAHGELQGDVMVVHCGDDMILETLDDPQVKDVIRDVVAQRTGKNITVRCVLGGGPVQNVDKLEELIRRGSRYDSFTVK
ncbi:MAG: DNA polymerase III subunit gamma/tau [Oscillospiraceae bacterium]|nr:DNA polymerase III subunit gamma/tau [Oscillospiraceae bacterium]